MQRDNSVWCSMIHGGLNLNFKSDPPTVSHCCLRPTSWLLNNHDPWGHPELTALRELNLSGQWDKNCYNCRSLENTGLVSFRQGMNQGLSVDSRGPARLDLMFDISCNLACRTCTPLFSTFWQKHLQQHGLWQPETIWKPKKSQEVIESLAKMDLSNLQQLVFCGGETLLGNTHWEVAQWLADNVPTCKQQLTLCFQTNGTQPIPKKYYDLIERFHLVKLHVSLDGVGQRFEYLRWPADWNQVTENLLHLKQTVPSNVMFLVEETVSIFNLFYLNELEGWLAKNFLTNREGDPVVHTRHLARGIFSLENCSSKYREAMKNTKFYSLLPTQTANQDINSMLNKIDTFDKLRDQKFQEIFPEVAQFYQGFQDR